jgi:hypothetical protein
MPEEGGGAEAEGLPRPPKDWWQTFNFHEGASFEVLSEGDWWQVNSRQWQGSQVRVRYVGGDPDDDFWIGIDDKRLRPSQIPVGNHHAQVGNMVKGLFVDKDRIASWYTGEIIAYSEISEDNKPKEWRFTVEFEDHEKQTYKLPDPDVRVFVPLADIQDALSEAKTASQDALEDYAHKRELHRAVLNTLLGMVKTVHSECDSRAKARSKEVEASLHGPNQRAYNPLANKETYALQEYLALLREKLIGSDMIQPREWNQVSKRIFQPPRPFGPSQPAQAANGLAPRAEVSSGARGSVAATVPKITLSMPKQDGGEGLKLTLRLNAPTSFVTRGALVEVELGPEHGVAASLWELGRVVSVSENGMEVGVAVNNSIVDVSLNKVRPLGGGGGDLPLEFNGARAWVRSYKDGKYQLLVDGDDMSQGTEEGEWVECTSGDVRVDYELPLGREGEVVQVPSFLHTDTQTPMLSCRSVCLFHTRGACVCARTHTGEAQGKVGAGVDYRGKRRKQRWAAYD